MYATLVYYILSQSRNTETYKVGTTGWQLPNIFANGMLPYLQC